MAGGNAIGSAALFLTANADGMVAGLNKAEAKAKQFSANVGKSLSKVTGPTGGLGKLNGSGAIGKLGAVLGGSAGGILGGTVAGIGLGSMMGGPIGAIAGGLAGLTVGTAKAGFDMLTSLPGLYSSLQGSATGTNLSVLTGVSNSFEGLHAAGERLLTSVLVPLGPVFATAADSAGSFLDGIGPAFSFAADMGAGLLFTVVDIGSQIGEAIVEVGNWAASWTGLSNSAVTGSGLIFTGLKHVAGGAGQVFDVFRAGAGLVAVTFGKIGQAVGNLATDIDNVILGLAKLVQGAGIGVPKWLEDAVSNDKLLAAKFTGASTELEKWGRTQINAFGTGADLFEKKMAGIEARFGMSRTKLESTAAKMGETKAGGGPMFAAAIERGSKEAYSIEANYRYGNAGKGAGDDMKRIREETEKTRIATERLEKAIWKAVDKIDTF